MNSYSLGQFGATLGLIGCAFGFGYMIGGQQNECRIEDDVSCAQLARLKEEELTYWDVLHAPLGHKEKLVHSVANALGKSVPKSVARAVELPRSTGSKYAVQVASFTDFEDAQETLHELLLKDYPAKIVKGTLKGNQTVYRVRLHGFDTFAIAEKTRVKYEESEIKKAFTVAQK